ncbi:MAG: hypothetical protein WBO10_02700 [Pyrinomonadaceae bacterium]
MKDLIERTFLACAVLLLFAAAGSAQSNSKSASSRQRSVTSSALAAPGKVVIVVVGTAAKAAWGTTKFTAKHMAKPVAKTIFLKAAPKIGAFALKQTAKRALPLAVKLALL